MLLYTHELSHLFLSSSLSGSRNAVRPGRGRSRSRLRTAGQLIHLLNTALNGSLDRAVLLDVAGEDFILEVERDEAGSLGEDVVTAAGKEVERGNGVSGGRVKGLVVDQDADEAATSGEGRVVLDLDGSRDLEARGDGLVVELVNARDGTLENLEDIGAGVAQLGNGVAKGEGSKNFTTGDIANVDSCADATSVDESKVSEAGAVVKHGICHDVAKGALLSLAGRLNKLDGTGANNLGGELLKGNAPSLNLGLELGVLGGGVVEMDGATVVRDGMALLIKDDIDVTEILTPTPGSDNEDFASRSILDNGGVRALGVGVNATERSVGVATHDQRQASGLLGKALILVIANVSKSNNALDVSGGLNFINGSLNAGDNIDKLSARARVGDVASGLGGTADDGDAVLLKDLVGKNRLVESRVSRLDVGRNNREGQVEQELAQLVIASVELVVSEGL